MNFPNEISGTFTKNITLGTGSLRVYNGSSLFLTFTQDAIVVTDNSFSIDVSNLFPDNGDYFILIDEGLFISGAEVYKGISNPTKWTFTIADGEFEATEFSNEFLTN